MTNSKHLPFIRNDQYGEGGMAPQHFTEYLRIALVTILLVPFKVLGTICCILFVFASCKLASLLPRSMESSLSTWAGKIGSRMCLFCLGFLRVEWVQLSAGKHGPAAPREAVSIVSNHVSWLDILVHMSRSFPSFVARDGTQNLPLIGVVSRKMQCIYVRRENKDAGVPGVASRVKERMLQHATGQDRCMRPMLLFPEGTTTNGKFLLPFKTGAFLAGVPVQPVILHYHTGRMSPSWESITAPRQIFLVFCQLVHRVTCYELPAYQPSQEEQADPALYARNVRDYMLKYSKLQASHATLEDKRDYQQQLRQRLGMTQPGDAAKATATGAETPNCNGAKIVQN